MCQSDVLVEKHVTMHQQLIKTLEVDVSRRRMVQHMSPSYPRNSRDENLLEIMVPSAEQLQLVQYQLNYQFRDISRLVPCFKAAHRSDLDGIAEDGNRSLARIGVKIIDLVEKRYSPVVGMESRGKTKEHMLKTDRADNL